MKNFWMYFLLEYKKSIRLLRKTLFTLCLLLVSAAAGIVAATFALNQSNILKKVTVAMVIPQSENQTRLVVRFASTLDSVQSICSFSAYSDSEQAIADLRGGRVQACIVFPENFYEDADNGINTPAQVYVSDQPGVPDRLFRGLLYNGVSLLQTAQAGVYAVLDVSDQYETGLDREQLGDLMLQLYVEQLIFGGRLFDGLVVSPFDTLTTAQYGFCGLLMLSILLPGLLCGYFYRNKRYCLEQQLQRLHIGAWQISVIRVMVIANLLWLSFMSVYLAGCVYCLLGNVRLAAFSMESIAGIMVLCLTFSAMIHMIFSVCGDSRTGTMLTFFTELWLFLGSGMLIPVSYLPESVQHISESLQMPLFGRFLRQLLYHDFDGNMAARLTVLMSIFFGIGVIGQWRRISSGFGSFLRSR